MSETEIPAVVELNHVYFDHKDKQLKRRELDNTMTILPLQVPPTNVIRRFFEDGRAGYIKCRANYDYASFQLRCLVETLQYAISICAEKDAQIAELGGYARDTQ